MEQKISETSEILLYQNGDDKEYIRVIFQDENFWLTQAGMAELFDSSKSNISEHLTHIFDEEELDKAACMRKFGISEFSTKPTHFYNLDAIIAVGYRVNSKKATRFRQWATRTLKEYIQKGFVLNDELMKNGRPFGKDYFDELMAEDEQLMSMQDWLEETDRFLTNNRRQVLESKGHISRDAAMKKVGAIYDEFRKKQDAEYISEFDREIAKYLKGGESH